MNLTDAQRNALSAIADGPRQGRYGRSAFPQGVNGNCLLKLESMGLVTSCDGEIGRRWSITDAGRKALE